MTSPLAAKLPLRFVKLWKVPSRPVINKAGASIFDQGNREKGFMVALRIALRSCVFTVIRATSVTEGRRATLHHTSSMFHP